jgi:hypothetical protein
LDTPLGSTPRPQFLWTADLILISDEIPAKMYGIPESIGSRNVVSTNIFVPLICKYHSCCSHSLPKNQSTIHLDMGDSLVFARIEDERGKEILDPFYLIKSMSGNYH